SPHPPRIQPPLSHILHFFHNHFSTYFFQPLTHNPSQLHITTTNFHHPLPLPHPKPHHYILPLHRYKPHEPIHHTLLPPTHYHPPQKILNSLHPNPFS
ncbi:poly-gamma-glutamate hydrolase family protein, partial [Bacillus pumilus]|uniref:poly-gamma-glutamate hydrolase family protein n=1 Tax=Bacillus pumilus TaxID=1408 RepID=UPI00164334D7